MKAQHVNEEYPNNLLTYWLVTYSFNHYLWMWDAADELLVLHTSDRVTRINDWTTRVTIFEDSTRVTFFTESLDSSRNHWLETRVRVIFAKARNIKSVS